IFCLSERAINVLDGLRLIRGWWISYGVRGNRPPFTRPFVESAIENANVLMAVVMKSPRNHPHYLRGGIVNDHCHVIADAQVSRHPIEFLGSRHILIGCSRNSSKPGQVDCARNVASAVLLWGPCIDDTYLRVIEMLREPFRFCEQLWTRVIALTHWSKCHKYLRPER